MTIKIRVVIGRIAAALTRPTLAALIPEQIETFAPTLATQIPRVRTNTLTTRELHLRIEHLRSVLCDRTLTRRLGSVTGTPLTQDDLF